MRVRVRNNRLALEVKVENLSEISEQKLREVAAKYQIGWGRFVEKDVPIMSRGVTRLQRERVMEPKPRKVLEDEIRKYLSITLVTPKEYWTKDQEEAFTSNDLINEKDVNREISIKRDAKIEQVLPPFENTKDKYAEIKLIGDLTGDQWEYFKEYYNTVIDLKKDADGRIIGRDKKYVHRLIAHEYIPETEEEKELVNENGMLKQKSVLNAERKAAKDADEA